MSERYGKNYHDETFSRSIQHCLNHDSLPRTTLFVPWLQTYGQYLVMKNQANRPLIVFSFTFSTVTFDRVEPNLP